MPIRDIWQIPAGRTTKLALVTKAHWRVSAATAMMHHRGESTEGPPWQTSSQSRTSSSATRSWSRLTTLTCASPREIFGLLGPNGSGKTTSINCIAAAASLRQGQRSPLWPGHGPRPLRPQAPHRRRSPAGGRLRGAHRPREHRLLLQPLRTTALVAASWWTRPSSSWASRTSALPPAEALRRPGPAPEHCLWHRPQARAHLLRRAHGGR